jgi:hypothetical protein
MKLQNLTPGRAEAMTPAELASMQVRTCIRYNSKHTLDQCERILTILSKYSSLLPLRLVLPIFDT